MSSVFLRLFCALLVLGIAPSADAKPPSSAEILGSAMSPQVVSNRLGRYVPVEIGTKLTIPPLLKPVLAHLRTAADHVDSIYWSQVSPGADAMRTTVSKSSARAAQELAELMTIHYGPWDRHADDQPFVGKQPRPPGANFYPADVSRRELESWLSSNPGSRDDFWSNYTVIRRKGAGLEAVPYSKAYADDLGAASKALNDAAESYRCSDDMRSRGQCSCDPLVQFLRARADSFTNDDYRKSELEWLAASDCPIDIAIGPYEFYEDRLFGVKTAFEAIITIKDTKESQRFAALAEHSSELHANLPLPAAVRSRFERVKQSPIAISDVLYTSGDARAGYHMRAFLLPNDEVVREARGTKNVILRNVVRAKFDSLLRPMARRIFGKKDQKYLSFDAYFDMLLSWQLAHGIIPGPISLPDGTTTTAQKQLRDRFTIIQAVKGEAVAMVNYFFLADKGLLPSTGASKMAVTYLASLFDSARLAAGSPQTIAKIIVYNYLAQEWVFRYSPRTQLFEVNPPAMRKAAGKLAGEALEVLARGDYDGAGRMIVQYGIMPGEMRQKLAGLDDLPVDIRPTYVSVPRL